MPQIITRRDELQQRVKDGAHLIEVLPPRSSPASAGSDQHPAGKAQRKDHRKPG
jgi:hypothetical protein